MNLRGKNGIDCDVCS